MSGDSKDPKSISELNLLLAKYPNVSIVEKRAGNAFTIRIHNELSWNEIMALSVFLHYDKETGRLNPSISHQIPSTEDCVYIEFTSEGMVSLGVEYDNIPTLLYIAKAGLEIMQTFKQLSPEERSQIEDFSPSRVFDGRQLEGPTQPTNDCLERTLFAINQELGEE